MTSPTDVSNRDLLRFITCGSVDDGKSTLIGRLLHDAGAVPEDQLAALHRDSRMIGNAGERTDYALLVDGLTAEREQGITIDVAYRYFSTPRRKFIVADTPGHEQYTRNMVTGASTADVAVVLVDARKGVLDQTRRHAYLVSLLGIRTVILAVTKMDLVDWSQAKFNTVTEAFGAFAAGVGLTQVIAIPVSGLDGDNIASSSSKTPWHSGPTLLEALETVDVEPAAETAATVTAMGHEPVVAPLLSIQPVAQPMPDLADVAGLVFTSRNGVAAFEALLAATDRDQKARALGKPVFAVGHATAQAAREAGFGAVRSAGGDLGDLARLIRTVWTDPAGILLHPVARVPAGDLARAVGNAAVIRPLVVYEAAAHEGAAPDRIDLVMLHSPRAARRLAELIAAGSVVAKGLSAVAISAAAAQALAGLGLAQIVVADHPDENGMTEALGKALLPV